MGKPVPRTYSMDPLSHPGDGFNRVPLLSYGSLFPLGRPWTPLGLDPKSPSLVVRTRLRNSTYETGRRTRTLTEPISDSSSPRGQGKFCG